MGSKKRAAWAKQKAEFDAQLGGSGRGFDDIFAREEQRRAEASEKRESALRNKACESKNRYAFLSDAEEAIELCALHGTKGLHAYRCPYCNGWHLTSKPRKDS